ncbi:MAG: energy-coupling factor ABC transporter permease [Terrimicrobiaceae bacterium]
MHIPTGMMDGAVCPVTAVVAAAGIGAAAWAALKSDEKPEVLKFASVSALIFAAQMVNFPVASGTSGHLLGGVLASALLGTPFGVLALGLVLAVQCLLFSDGGVSLLGANIVNMSLIGAGLGGLIAGSVRGRSPLSLARLGFAAWISVPLAALACSVELALSGAVPFATSAPAMLGTHAVIGAGEALITVLAFSLLSAPAATTSRKGALAPALAAIVIALVLSPFASGLPDGLEWVASRLGFLHESAPAFVAPLAEYSLSASLPAVLSTGLAGLAGVLVVFVLGSAVSLAWNTPRLCRVS